MQGQTLRLLLSPVKPWAAGAAPCWRRPRTPTDHGAALRHRRARRHRMGARVKAFAREVETQTNGEVPHQVVLRRHRRRRAADDGAHQPRPARRRRSAAMAASGWRRRCAPCTSPGSSRAARSLATSSAAAAAALRRGIRAARLRSTSASGFGRPDILFSRKPVAHARGPAARHAVDLGPRRSSTARSCAAHRAPARAARRRGRGPRLREERVDGFIAIPTAALAYQWSAQARYFTPLRVGFLPGCMVMANAALDALPIEQQQALRHAAAS